MKTTSLPQRAPRRRHVAPQARWAFGLVIVVITALCLVLSTNAPNFTAAHWHSSRAAAGAFQAGNVPAPTLTGQCQFRPGILGLGARVRIFGAYRMATLDDVEVHASTSGLGSVLAPLTGFSLSGNTVTTAQGYRTDVPTNLLGGLLGLGSDWRYYCCHRWLVDLPGCCSRGQQCRSTCRHRRKLSQPHLTTVGLGLTAA